MSAIVKALVTGACTMRRVPTNSHDEFSSTTSRLKTREWKMRDRPRV